MVVRARGDNITKQDDDARDDANGVEPSHDDAGKEPKSLIKKYEESSHELSLFSLVLFLYIPCTLSDLLIRFIRNQGNRPMDQ